MKLPTPVFPKAFVAGLTAGGFLLRLWFNLVQHPLGAFLFSDMRTYHQRATNLLSGNLGPWDTFTPVGYPAFIALLYGFSGNSTIIVGIAHAFLGAATCWLAACVAWRLNHHRIGTILIAAFSAFHLPLLSYGGLLMTETLSTFLATLFIFLFIRARECPAAGRWMAAGVILAISVLVRPYMALLYPLLGIYFWSVFRPDRKKAAKSLFVVLLAASPFFAASAIHNSWLVGRFNLFGTNGGLNFFLAHSDYRTAETQSGGKIDYSITPIPNSWRNRGVFSSPTPLYEEAFFYRKAFSIIAGKPSRLFTDLRNLKEGLGLGKTRFWPGWQTKWWLLEIFNKSFFWLIGLPGLVFLSVSLVKKKLFTPEHADDLLVGLLWAVIVTTLYAFLGDPRVRVPFDFVFAALALKAWISALRALRRRPAQIPRC